MKHLYWLLGISLVVCIVWHIVLWFVPVDGLAGTANFQAGQFHLRYTAPPDSQWSEGGVALYRTVLRVDARSINDWLNNPFDSRRRLWDVGSAHQYLVERRDGDGKRVINTPLQSINLRYLLSYPIIAILAALLHLIVAVVLIRRFPTLPVVQPFTMLTIGQLLNLSWTIFAVPFSYVALGWPFWGQLVFHTVANILTLGALVHLAMTFINPLAWFTAHRRLVLVTIYGLYPLGLAVVLLFQPDLPNRLTAAGLWESQAAVALKGIAYALWAVQYRRATVSQRGQLHWVLAATAAYDLPYLISVIAGTDSLLIPQLLLAFLPPLGYALAILPGRRMRFRLTGTTGFIHGIASTLIAALFLSGLGLAANILATDRQRDSFSIITILLALIFALTTVPLVSLLREQLDSWFNGTRSAQRALLHQFTGKVSSQIALSAVTDAFRETLEQAVQPAHAALWLWDSDAHALRSVGLSSDAPAIIPLDDTTQQSLHQLTTFTPAGQLRFWPEGQHYFGAISLIASGHLVGVCAIGPRIDGGSYSNDTLRFLETLTRSATLAFRNAQLIAQLEDKIAALRSAYQQLITMQESERQHLAAELHDETLQQLAHAHLITAQLRTATNGVAETNLNELQQTLHTSERRLREILRGVHPAVLTDLGLEAALKSWLPRSKNVSITFTSNFAGRRLPDPSLEMTLYRLAQESINNALKHAQAKYIKLDLRWQDTLVQVEITDDGVGFSPALHLAQLRRTTHFGLLNLRERVNAFGGTLDIMSQPGKGTTVRACLPVTESVKDSKA